MAKRKKVKRRRTKSEVIMIILGILIAVSMILSLFVGLGQSSRNQNAPIPPDQLYDYENAGETLGGNATEQELPNVIGFLNSLSNLPVV